MKKRELQNLGVPREALDLAISSIRALAGAGLTQAQIRKRLRDVIAAPEAWTEDGAVGEFAALLLSPVMTPAGRGAAARAADLPLAQPVPWRQWGTDLEPEAVQQMANACVLPVAVRGALMPDAHLGYGLPIGGVLATDGAVVPYAVGVDIACRMKLSILDMPVDSLRRRSHLLQQAISDETRFGMGAAFERPREHPVMDRDWSVTAVTRQHRDKAWRQLGSSGSGNHFVEFGVVSLSRPELGLEPGDYLAVLSHSGSRGVGAAVCGLYSRIARELHPKLPKALQHLAWLELDSPEGREYWDAMTLMGDYAAANHDCIHRHLARHLGAHIIAGVENHHNFAWKEVHDGRELIVHRKGATPAGAGVLGVIPGSMATPGYVVRGRGSAESLQSASHGAGRVMSRSRAKETFTWKAVREQLDQAGITLMSAGLDEVPGVYKDIHSVMNAQTDLVDIIARFDPKIVKMAPPGEKPED